MKKAKTGIIGMGMIGPAHLEALRRQNHVQVVAVAVDPEQGGEETAKRFGINKGYDGWEALVEDPEVEVIHVCAPNHLHAPIIRKALSLNKHVVCDKPLTLDLDEAKSLVELAKTKDVVTALTLDMAYYPLVQQSKKIVEKNDLGKINYVQGSYLQDWLLYETDYNWRVESKHMGPSRIVEDIGIHCLHMLQEIIGQKIVAVYADTNTFVKTRKKPKVQVATFQKADENQEFTDVEVDTDDQATVLLKFENGTKGVFLGGQVFAGRKNHISWEIYGTDKSLAWNGEEPNKLWIGARDTTNEILMKDFNLVDESLMGLCHYAGGLQEGYSETWKNIMTNIYHDILTGERAKNYPTFEDGLQLQTVVEATVESSKKNKWVEIEY